MFLKLESAFYPGYFINLNLKIYKVINVFEKNGICDVTVRSKQVVGYRYKTFKSVLVNEDLHKFLEGN